MNFEEWLETSYSGTQIDDVTTGMIRTAFEAGRHEAEMVSLRDKFAIAVLQGIFANPSGPIQSNTMSGWGWCNCEPNDVTSLVYLIADEMLKERNK